MTCDGQKGLKEQIINPQQPNGMLEDQKGRKNRELHAGKLFMLSLRTCSSQHNWGQCLITGQNDIVDFDWGLGTFLKSPAEMGQEQAHAGSSKQNKLQTEAGVLHDGSSTSILALMIHNICLICI